MRLLAELLIAAGLVALGWQTSYHERLGEFIPAFQKQTVSVRASARPAPATTSGPAGEDEQPAPPAEAPPTATNNTRPTGGGASPSGAWMWDSKRPGSLDRPGQSPTPTTFTGHIFYTDENGRKYWLDAQGKRHYE